MMRSTYLPHQVTCRDPNAYGSSATPSMIQNVNGRDNNRIYTALDSRSYC